MCAVEAQLLAEASFHCRSYNPNALRPLRAAAPRTSRTHSTPADGRARASRRAPRAAPPRNDQDAAPPPPEDTDDTPDDQRVFRRPRDGEKECFLIEQPLDTQLTIKYELPANEKTEDKRVKVTLTDRRTKTQIFSKVVSDHKSELSMATGSEAAHDLCLKPQSPGKVRVNLEIEPGHGQKYYAEMASENKMDRLQVEVVKLNDELAEILNEADYMKEKEVPLPPEGGADQRGRGVVARVANRHPGPDGGAAGPVAEELAGLNLLTFKRLHGP